MLNWNKVLLFVKGRVSLPSSFIEKADKQLIEWVTEISIPTFSKYVPDWERCVVNPGLPYNQTDKTNIYRFYDPEDLPIYGTRNFYWDGSGNFATGHPVVGPTTFEGMKDWALEVFKSKMLKPFSYWSYTGRFIRPNKVQVLPTINSCFVVEYEREQPHDLRKIPNEHTRNFMDLALSDVMLWLGSMRSMYGDGRIQTPFGEIPLNGDSLKTEGQELQRETIEKLKDESLPGVVIDIE
jgi:hypothetical protein